MAVWYSLQRVTSSPKGYLMQFCRPHNLCKLFFLLFLLSFSTAFCDKETELDVELKTEYQVMPVLLHPIEDKKSAFTSDYLQSLFSVMIFDINHSGIMELYTPEEGKLNQPVIDKTSFENPCDGAFLTKHKTYLALYPKISDRDLSIKIVTCNSTTTKTFENMGLSGHLSKDRTTIHRFMDALVRLVFQKEGVASSRFIYTLTKKVQTGGDDAGQKYISEVFEADYDGENRRQLTNEKALVATPCYVPSPDGLRSSNIIYVSYKIGQPKLHHLSLKDGKSKRVSPLRSCQMTPSVSKDGSLIAFASDVTGTSDIFVQPFNKTAGPIGKPRQIFKAKGAASASCAFSPDGKKIAFVTNKDGVARVYLMDFPKESTKLTDLQPRLLSKACRESTAPVWSPDGKKIAFSGKNQDVRQIWVYDLETQKEYQLTDGRTSKENPTWAANGTHLYYNAKDSTGWEVYLIDTNRKKPSKIILGLGDKQFPCSEP